MTSHILPKRTYYTIFAILILCTGLTVWVAFLDLGPFNTIAALTIAVFKASLVVLFFMHVKYSSRLTWLVVVSGFVFLAIMIGFTMSDVVSRGWLGTPGG